MSKITRDDVVREALAQRGARYHHQGREPFKFLDCVGLLAVVADRLGYEIDSKLDAFKFVREPSYKRTPSASELLGALRAFCDEIPVSEVVRGDFYLMRLGGRKPRHTAIRISDRLDVKNGIYPRMVHASGSVGFVLDQDIRSFAKGFSHGFRLRGIED